MEGTENEAKHCQTFEDLEVYQVAREFRKAMYRVAGRLPEEEKFALMNQMRRAAVSLTSNIAEGHGRFHFVEQIKFMLQSRGSLEELLDDLNVCQDQAHLPTEEIESLRHDGWRVHKLINGYIWFLRRRVSGDSPRVREATAIDPVGENELEDLFPDDFNPSPLQHFNE
jgi:four helix bundle protein